MKISPATCLSLRRLCVPIVSSLVLLAWPFQDALACACCSDFGTRIDAVVKVTEFHRVQIAGMEFDSEAELFMTEAGEDDVKGISAIATKYELKAVLDEKAKHWRLTFRTEDGKTGTLTLPIPAKLGVFQIDPRDDQKSAGGGPLLYKEWRWHGVPKAEGIFAKGAQRFSLVFQGRGNRCDDASNFTHWHLEITGKGVSYALYGELKVP